MILKNSSLALLLTLLVTSYSDAGFVLNFSVPSATINVGQSIDVDLVLTQSGTIVGTDITTNGLVMVDVELMLNTSAASISAIRAGQGFEDSLFGSNPTTPLMSIQSVDAVNGVLAPIGSPTSIVLGTFTFTGNSVGTTTATTLNRSFTDFVFKTNPSPNPDIDGLIFGTESFTVNVTAVPEPSSVLMIVAPLCALLARTISSRRKRFSPLRT